MKKLYTLGIAMSLSVAAFSQKVIDIETTVMSPANGATLTIGQSFPFQVVFKNKGTGAIAPSDTLYFAFTGSSSLYYITGKTKAVNDTIYLNTTLTFTSGTNGTMNFCVASIVANGTTITDSDTTNNRDCNSVTLTGGSTGVLDVVMGDGAIKQQLAIFPNPASTSINFDFKAVGNDEVTARVFDLSGREVLVHKYSKVYSGKNDFSLDISGLTNGLYFVEIRQNNIRATGKLNKQ